MAEESGLEEGVRNEEVKEKKKGRWGKLLFLGAMATGATALFMATAPITTPVFGAVKVSAAFGPAVGGLLGGGILAGGIIKKRPFYDIVKKALTTYTAFNMVLAPITMLGSYTFPIAGSIGGSVAGPAGAAVAKTAYSATAFNSTLVVGFKGSYHLVDNYFNPKGMFSYIKEDFWSLNNRMAVGFLPTYATIPNSITHLSFSTATATATLPIFPLNLAGYVIYNAFTPEKKTEEKKAGRAPKPENSLRAIPAATHAKAA